MTAEAKGPSVATGIETAPEARGAAAPESRRRALARLGLASIAVYAAPTVLRIDRSARAVILPSECEPPPDFPPGFPPLCP